MKICITGINGFVGNNLRKTLEDEGHDVCGIDKNSSDSRVIEADITDLGAVNKIFADLKPDYIYHLAAISRPDYKNPDEIYAINVSGSYNVLSAAVQFTRNPRFVFASSAQVYGNVDPDQLPISEECPVNPVNHYGASKAAVEDILKAFNREHDLEYVVLRPFNHIGLGQNPHFVVPKIVNAFKNRKSELELGDTETVRDFLDVRDAVRLYADLLNTFPSGETFNICTSRGVKIRDIFNILEDICGYTMELKQSPELLRKNEIRTIIGDNKKVKEHLNWEPACSLRDTLNWILDSDE